MKNEAIKILKDKGYYYLFTEDRYKVAKNLLKLAGKDAHSLFRIDPHYKSVWIADMIINNFAIREEKN